MAIEAANVVFRMACSRPKLLRTPSYRPLIRPVSNASARQPDGNFMSADTVKVGIVGLGRWARVLARAAAKSDALKIAAGYSRGLDKREAFAREFGIPTVESFDAILADPALKGV